LSDNDLLVMVPTRGRRAQCEWLLESFTATATCADLTFIIDGDDQDTYDGMDGGEAACAVLDPRAYLTGKLNATAMAVADAYRVLMWVGDDNVFVTPGWDKIMLDALDDLGGSGWIYPDDKRRSDVPEHWMCSSDLVKALGWFAPPYMSLPDRQRRGGTREAGRADPVLPRGRHRAPPLLRRSGHRARRVVPVH